MKQWIKTLALAFAAIFLGAVVSAIPPLPGWFAAVDAHQMPWLAATGATGLLGLTLMMGGILDLLMARDQTLGHDDAEDVERSVRMEAQPASWRAASYRVWGTAAGRAGADEFTFREMKQAWRSGAWRRETTWRRRYLTALGALLLTIGVFGVVFTLAPSPIKAIVVAALLYAAVKVAQGFARA